MPTHWRPSTPILSGIPEGFYSVGAVDKLQEAMDNGAVLIDVREDTEYADGAIPGAVNIPIRTLAKNLDQIPTDKPVVVYCASGHRAAMANAMLHVLGYDNVRAFPAGYGAWEAAQGESGDVPAEVAAAINSDTDVVATVDAFLSALPDNFRSVGNLEAFKAAIESANPLLIDVREPERLRRRPHRRRGQHPDPHPGGQPGQDSGRQAGDRLLRVRPARRHEHGSAGHVGL